MYISGKSIRSSTTAGALFFILMYHFENVEAHFVGGVTYFVFMLALSFLQDNRTLSKQPSYVAVEFFLKFSKVETILKLNEVFGIIQYGDMLVVKDINLALQFLDENKVRVTGSGREVAKFEKLFSLQNQDLASASNL